MRFRFHPIVRGVIAEAGSIFGYGEDQDIPENKLYDTDESGKQLYKEDIIKLVTEELERRKTERSMLELQWTLNANFLVGNQYCDINYHSGSIEQVLPADDHLERETFNQIAPIIDTRIANLKKLNYAMQVKPATNELDDYAKAEISTAVLKYVQKNSDFETKKNTAIAWSELCGNCFWLSWWDSAKGSEVARITVSEQDEDGQETTHEEGFYEGDLDYGLITPYELYPESVFKQGIDAQRSIILEQVKTTSDVYDLFGIQMDGGSVETFELTPLPSALGYGRETTVCGLGHRSIDDAVKVITYMERPSKHYPDGRMIILIDDREIVYYGKLPYREIPIVQQVCREIPGQFYGKSVIEDLIPRQRAYNGCVNRIHEYIKRVTIQGYFAEEGAIDLDEYAERGAAPGAIVEYQPGHNPPRPMQNGNLPSEILNERYNLVRDMEYVAGVSQLMTTGSTPSGVTSGTAIESLKATDDTRLSLTGDQIRNCIRRLAQMWLKIYKQFATTRRVVNYVGSNSIGNAFVWSAEEINSFDVDYTTENELLLSEDEQKQRFFEAMNLGLFTDSNGQLPERVKQRALEFMKIGNYSEIMNINTLQIQAAQRENTFFAEGVIPEVSEFDDHEIHFEEHLRYILQMDFRVLKQRKPEYAKALEDHAKMHKQAIEQENQMKLLQAMQGGK